MPIIEQAKLDQTLSYLSNLFNPLLFSSIEKEPFLRLDEERSVKSVTNGHTRHATKYTMNRYVGPVWPFLFFFFF